MQPVTHNQLGTKSISGAPEESEAPEMIGGPSRTRTLDPLIKSCPEPRTHDAQGDPSLTNQRDRD